MKLLELLKWRYATKRMNSQEISDDKIQRILEAIRLSASSIGLQPYTIFNITNRSLLEKIKPIANDQPQITECSNLLVFAAWQTITEERIEAYFDDMQQQRGLVLERNKVHIVNLRKRIENESPERFFDWMARQAYIALGTGLIAAAAEGVDATPMEGFNKEALDELLNLSQQNLKSVLMMPLGYRDEVTDFLLPLAKVRRNKEKLYININ